jgi:hypothetical protein
VSALNHFEQFLENMVEGSVARLFRSRVEPAEIAKRLERAMESQQTISVRRIIVPNAYRVFLNPEDFAVLQAFRSELEREMTTYLRELADERGFTMLEHPRVELASDQAVPRRGIQVVAETTGGAQPNGSGGTQVMSGTAVMQAPSAVARTSATLILQTPHGPQLIPLESTLLSVGRGLGNDIILEDSRVSRNHAELRYKNRRFWLIDRGSTNGTFVNNERVSEQALRGGDVISLGGLELAFREG